MSIDRSRPGFPSPFYTAPAPAPAPAPAAAPAPALPPAQPASSFRLKSLAMSALRAVGQVFKGLFSSCAGFGLSLLGRVEALAESLRVAFNAKFERLSHYFSPSR